MWQVTPKYTHTLDPTKSEWADYAAAQAHRGNLSGNELTRNLSRDIRPRSSQLAEPLWTDPGMRSRIRARDLICTSKRKEKKSAGGKLLAEQSPKILASEEKGNTPPPPLAPW